MKILNYMNESSEIPSQTRYDFDGDIDRIAKSVSSDAESVRAAVRDLESNGFIKFSRAGSVTLDFYLDHKGMHHKEMRMLESRERWKERIIGFALGVITASVPWFLGMLKW
ncbi:hypothetical protein [Oscillibacter ruminantium]|uniref:hypothetical protein n=1 Tax=Oscillibacter ruminantium TaxID=1263547 RepID=UPI00331DCD62